MAPWSKVIEVEYRRTITGLVVIDPYNDFISEGGKVWDRLKGVAEANPGCHRAVDRLTSSGRRSEAAFEMTVLDAGGLHERVGNNRADHLKPRFPHRERKPL